MPDSPEQPLDPMTGRRRRSRAASQDGAGPNPAARLIASGGVLAVAVLIGLCVIPWALFNFFLIDIDKGKMAVLTRKTGKDIPNDAEVAPGPDFKGLQAEVLSSEGRHFFNPYDWDWDVVDQINIPENQIGVRVRLHGDPPPPGEIIANKDSEKGIVPDVLMPGRHAINAVISQPGQAGFPRDNFVELIELHSFTTVPAGFKGIVTNLTGAMPKEANTLLMADHERGPQESTLDAGTYPINPYLERINLVDCRSQRFNLSEGGEMGFPSKDGFWITLDGIIEFRVIPEKASLVFVTYNDRANDTEGDARVTDEIIKSVILPNARAFCRLRGSDHSGREFISGDTRTKFQEDFQAQLKDTCQSQGIEIIQALITRINPPQQIAQPVRERQIAIQEEEQYQRQIAQQAAEKDLAIEQETVKQRQALVATEQDVVKLTTESKKRQQVAVIEANTRLKTAEFQLKAAQDKAAATRSLGQADVRKIELENEAAAAGWKSAVAAFNGDGGAYARYMLLTKLAPSFRSMMVNTADSPLMDIFGEFDSGPAGPSVRPPLRADAPAEVGSPTQASPSDADRRGEPDARPSSGSSPSETSPPGSTPDVRETTSTPRREGD